MRTLPPITWNCQWRAIIREEMDRTGAQEIHQRCSTDDPVTIGVPPLVEADQRPQPYDTLGNKGDRSEYEENQYQCTTGCHVPFFDRCLPLSGTTHTPGIPTPVDT